MYPTLFEIGSLQIHSFGAMVALGFIAALFLIKRDLERKDLDPELGSTIITVAMVGGLVGAKLYYVFFETPSTLSIWDAIFSGSGLTWYGGFAVAGIAAAVVIRRSGAPLLPVADSLGIGLAAGYGVGRIGCQLAGDGDYGVPTDLPWGMAYPDGVVPTLEIVHPTPVYESLISLLICGLLWITREKMGVDGLTFSLYLIAAGLARFLVEFVRINQKVLWGLSDAQLLSTVMTLGGVALAIRLWPYREAAHD